MERPCWGPVALSGRWPPSEEAGGSGRAFGPALRLQTPPAPSAPPAVTERPKPGASAEAASGGRLEDSGEILAKPKEEEEEEKDLLLLLLLQEEEDGCAPAGLIEAVERTSEEAAEAERWRQVSASELTMFL